jgi:hypothetical protein
MAARSTGLVARGVAALVCILCLAGIVRIARSPPETSPAFTAAQAPGNDCATRKRAEIEQRKAAGQLTTEQAMIQRQKIAKECS